MNRSRAINARTGEPLNTDALPEHGGDCWGANCSGDCAEKASLIRRSMTFLLGVVEKPIDMITDEELAVVTPAPATGPGAVIGRRHSVRLVKDGDA